MKKFTIVIIVAFFVSFTEIYAQSDSSVIRIVLLRHSEKMSDGSRDPDLTARGKNYAESLQVFLSGISFDAAFSTSYKRTRQTISKVAEANGIPLREYEATSIRSVLEVIREHRFRSVIVAGHSNTIPALVNSLQTQSVIPEMDESDYGKVFIVNYYPETPAYNTVTVLNTREFLK